LVGGGDVRLDDLPGSASVRLDPDRLNLNIVGSEA
jgi:hypothetical protein